MPRYLVYTCTFIKHIHIEAGADLGASIKSIGKNESPITNEHPNNESRALIKNIHKCNRRDRHCDVRVPLRRRMYILSLVSMRRDSWAWVHRICREYTGVWQQHTTVISRFACNCIRRRSDLRWIARGVVRDVDRSGSNQIRTYRYRELAISWRLSIGNGFHFCCT
jgi:hypothetical protein